MEEIRHKRKTRVGIVISDKMQKTRVVQTQRLVRHHKYSRIMRSFKKFKVHDEQNVSKAGDKVIIRETRPLSKEKHWILVEVIK